VRHLYEIIAVVTGVSGRPWQTPRLFLLCALVASPALLSAQISPGPLSKLHRDLDGPTGCTKCHAVSAGAPTYRCIDCHQEIAVRLRDKHGYHAAVMDATERYQACVKCHSEHNGVNFPLIRWNPPMASFDHGKTGFVLEGKHLGLACAKCHNPQKISPDERGAIRLKDISQSFLGLKQTCSPCHEDKHNGRLGNNCVRCHNTMDWKGARGFDHSKARFVLTGAHTTVSCEKCHTPIPGEAPKFVGLRFEQCSSCHVDVHKGSFKQTCESCHNTITWKQTTFAAKFDHSKTEYPLLGKHLELRCDTCHRAGNFKDRIAHQVCADCHQPDPHNGQFAKRQDGGRCESCHTVNGFKETTFSVKEHGLGVFPLRGKHASVECSKCHIPAGKATVFKVQFSQCTSCHKDEHRNQFANAPYFNRCERCHTENDFHVTTFSLARHQKTAFALSGSHIATPCIECHKPLAGSPASSASYHFADLSCTSCHEDPHRNQFAARMTAVANGHAAGCQACHNTSTWTDIGKFDHASTRFLLAGAHRSTDCAGCHRPPNLERDLKNVDFRTAPTICEDCHDDPHGKQFARGANATHCADCHNSTKWRPALFDHETTKFSLKGAHEQVKCKACHVAVQTVNGKDVLFYKPAPLKCAVCHSNSNVKVGMLQLMAGTGERT
jgi:Cytochrome c7 and related cytochrome c